MLLILLSRGGVTIEHLENDFMLHLIKSLFKVYLENHQFLVRLMAKMLVFKRSSQAIMNVSSFYEAILILVHSFENNTMQSISQ
jgi:hypothetical protein